MLLRLHLSVSMYCFDRFEKHGKMYQMEKNIARLVLSCISSVSFPSLFFPFPVISPFHHPYCGSLDCDTHFTERYVKCMYIIVPFCQQILLRGNPFLGTRIWDLTLPSKHKKQSVSISLLPPSLFLFSLLLIVLLPFLLNCQTVPSSVLS